jgi:ankyrin repeat protein
MVLAALALSVAVAGPADPPSSDLLLQAVRKGDLAAAKAALDAGVPVDAKFRYDRTALSFAADRGQAEIVKLLLDRGADANAKDSFYGVTPIVWAANNGHAEVARLLLAHGATGAGDVLESGVEKKSVELVDAAIASGKLSAEELSFALEDADRAGAADVAAALRKTGAVPPPKADFKVDPATLARYAGRYKEASPGGSATAEATVADGVMQLTFGGGPSKLGAFSPTTFRLQDDGRIRFTFKVEDGRVKGFTMNQPGRERWFAREEAPAP